MNSAFKNRCFVQGLLAFFVVMAGLAARAEESTTVKGSGFMAVPEESETSSSTTPEASMPALGTAQAPIRKTVGPSSTTPASSLPVSTVPDHKVASEVETPAPSPLDPTMTKEEALRQAWVEELNAIKRKEELELEAIHTRDEAYRKNAEIDLELTQKRRKIFDLQSKQTEYANEISIMKSEIVELDGKSTELQKDVVAAEEHAKLHHEKYMDVKKELDQTKDQLTSTLDQLHKTRDMTAKKVNLYMIQMQQMRAEVATLEADSARADNDRVRAEAEELQMRSQWSALTARTQSMRQDKARIMAELSDMQARLKSARNEYQLAKEAYEKVEKEKLAAQMDAARQRTEITSELRKLEQDTAYVSGAKSSDEAEKVRLQAEIDKLKTDLAFVKKRHADAHEEAAESEGTVMESRLAFETAKADLTRELATGEAAALKDDARAVQLRGLASVVDQSDMLDAHKPWIATKACLVMRTPVNNGEAGGRVTSGERLIAAPAGGGFVKILNSSGRPAYLPMNCGHFTE